MRNWGTLLSAAGLVTAVPIAAWGLMGQQNVDGMPPDELDYAFQPLGIPDGPAAVIGVIALLVAGVSAVRLVRAGAGGALDRRWWQVLGPLVMAGLIVGVGSRILTAGVIGANIGAGLAIMAGGPVVAGLALWALVRAVWLAIRRPGAGGGRGHGIGFSPRGT